MTGLRFDTPDPPPPAGSACLARLVVPGSGGSVVIEARGTVIRSEKGSVAVEFSTIDLDSYWHLRALVLLNAADPEQAEREFVSHWGIRPAAR